MPLDKSEVGGGICNIHSLGARDFSPSYGLAPRVFVGLKSHAPIDFVVRQLPIYRAVWHQWKIGAEGALFARACALVTRAEFFACHGEVKMV